MIQMREDGWKWNLRVVADRSLPRGITLSSRDATSRCNRYAMHLNSRIHR